MVHRLSALVQIDLDATYVRLLVTGCLTETNQHALYPLIRRARTLIPPVVVPIDLAGAAHVEAIGVDLLRWAVDHDGTMDGASPVAILLPGALPDHSPASVRMTRHLRVPGWSPA